MTEKLIYGREQLNEEFIHHKNRLEEARTALNTKLEEKLEIVRKREESEAQMLNNKASYKKYKKEERKRLFINLLQITATFGIPMLLCKFPMLPISLNTHAINIVLGSIIGFGDSVLIGIYMVDIADFKKECHIDNKDVMSYLEESTNEAVLDNEIIELKRNIQELDEKIAKLDEVIIKEQPQEEQTELEIDYNLLRSNKYRYFTQEMSKPKQKGLKK